MDNRRHSIICATLHSSLALVHTISYHIPKDSIYFCLSNHISDIMINNIFRNLSILNQFYNFYFLNMDISLGNCYPKMKCFIVGHKILMEESV